MLLKKILIVIGIMCATSLIGACLLLHGLRMGSQNQENISITK